MRRSRTPWLTALLSIALGVTWTAVSPSPLLPVDERPLSSAELGMSDIVQRACALEPDELVRIWRGYDPARSEDVIVVPREPNYVGTFRLTSHTGPWDYVQAIPLVFYGPGIVPASGHLAAASANLTDVFPTLGELLEVTLPARDGKVLHEVVAMSRRPRPRLVVVIVWDGAGRNVLGRWSNRWPTLRFLEARGVSYGDATVGSSPSITPSSHTTLGTGAWPRRHRVSAIKLRSGDSIVGAFDGLDPRSNVLSTIGDELDAGFRNRSRVGLVGWQSWHLGMLGHGRGLPGGDADLVAIVGPGGRVAGNREFFSTPAYLNAIAPGLHARAKELDRVDGVLDGLWRDKDALTRQSPAWVAHETDIVLEILRTGDFGGDVVPDLLFVNYKMTDIAGHQDSMESVEMAEALQAQDAALGRVLDHLEQHVHDYVVVVTADHAHTPPAVLTGAWPVNQQELIDDVNRAFDMPVGDSLIDDAHATGLWLDEEMSTEVDIDETDVAAWLNAYTIRQNWPEVTLPAGYEHRGEEQIIEAAFPGDRLDDVLLCAFGSETPPPEVGG